MAAVTQWHRLQSTGDGCVPACFSMLARRCGVTFDESAIPGTGTGWDLTSFPYEPRGLVRQKLVLELDHAGLVQVRVALAQPAWVAITVCGPLWVSVTGEREHPEFGALCSPGDWGDPFHSVIVTAETTTGFEVLDPFFAPADNPLIISGPELMRCIAGQAVIVALR